MVAFNCLLPSTYCLLLQTQAQCNGFVIKAGRPSSTLSNISTRKRAPEPGRPLHAEGVGDVSVPGRAPFSLGRPAALDEQPSNKRCWRGSVWGARRSPEGVSARARRG